MNENTASELGQIAFATYWERSAGKPLIMPDSWNMQTADIREDWEATAVAVAAHVTNPTAEDFDAAAGTPPIEPLRYALVEQMGHRATIASVREVTFCGKQMIEATDLKGGGTSLISPESIYEITWITEADALARTSPWTPPAITTGNPWGPDSLAEDDRGEWVDEAAEMASVPVADVDL